jgi:hypothetical protein
MKLKAIILLLLALGLCMAWLAAADWFFDSSPEDLIFRYHHGALAVVEDAAISLYTIPFLGQQIYDAIVPCSNPGKIDRSPLFILALIQIVLLFVFVGLAMRGYHLHRRIAKGYGLTLIFTSVSGFIALHVWLRPAIEYCCP